MLVYPQLRSGALSQYPIVKRMQKRTVVNTTADGRSCKFADGAAEVTRWRLEYASLSDEELANLQTLFTRAEGRLQPFTFLDPTANLLAWSDHLDHDTWERDPLLRLTAGAGANWTICNGGSERQRIGQTIAGPGAYVYCFSAYCRSQEARSVDLSIGSATRSVAIGQDWTRVAISANGDVTGETVAFALGIAGNGEVEVHGLQAEAQPSPSEYRPSLRGGVYPEARLDSDSFTFTSTAPNQHACTIEIIHVNSIRA